TSITARQARLTSPRRPKVPPLARSSPSPQRTRSSKASSDRAPCRVELRLSRRPPSPGGALINWTLPECAGEAPDRPRVGYPLAHHGYRSTQTLAARLRFVQGLGRIVRPSSSRVRSSLTIRSTSVSALGLTRPAFWA